MKSTTQSCDLTDHFLIAMPAMTDPHFAEARSTYHLRTQRAGRARRGGQPPHRHDVGTRCSRQIEIPLETGGRCRKAHPRATTAGRCRSTAALCCTRPIGARGSRRWPSSERGHRTHHLASDVLQAVARGEGDQNEITGDPGLRRLGARPAWSTNSAQNAWLTVAATSRTSCSPPPPKNVYRSQR